MGSAITPINFPCILTVKERYNPPDYFREGIIGDKSFFRRCGRTSLQSKTVCRNDAKIENKGAWNAKKVG